MPTVYLSSSGLNHHVLADHLGVKNEHECTECGKRFDRQSSMKQHVSEVHLKERNFKCQICHKTYPRNSYLLRHVRYFLMSSISSFQPGERVPLRFTSMIAEGCAEYFLSADARKWTFLGYPRNVSYGET